VSTHITKLTLNPSHRDVRADLRDAHRMHRRIMTMLPDHVGDTARADLNVLWRIENPGGGDTAPCVYVQASTPLDTSRSPRGYLTTHTTRDLAPLLAVIAERGTVRYQVTVNTSTRNGRTKRTIAVPGEQLMAWWERKAATAGLHINGALTDIGAPYVITGNKPDSQPIKHVGARIVGIATITDTDAITNAIVNGIGRGRAYGLGLITVIPTQ
jgi:CRISPR system Cascade subunit CasE